jgi:amidase
MPAIMADGAPRRVEDERVDDIQDPVGALVAGVRARRPGRAGPLRGTTFVVKDTIDVAGVVTGAGSPVWARTHPPADADAPCVRRLLDAGSELLGKARCAEMAWSLSGDNVHHGMPVNAAAPDRDPGGSSSGSAAAVAAGICDIGLGSDTLGSIRVPASYCGLWGLRPTHGAVPVAGLVPLAPSLDAVGAMTRDLATLRRAAEALLTDRWSKGRAPTALVVADDALELADAATRATLEQAIARAGAGLGAVSRVRPLGGPEGYAALMADVTVVQAREAWSALGAWVRAHRPRFGPGVAERFARAEAVTEAEAAAAGDRVAVARRLVRDLVPPGVVLALPAAPGPAPRRDADAAAIQQARLGAGALSAVAGIVGLPELVAPVAPAGGLPVGLGLVGADGSEATLMRAAEPLV